ncbi:MAG: HD domain-containing protein [Clostridia bacterium]|nr:HD domain-containing protein [Clostridia bacterium]
MLIYKDKLNIELEEDIDYVKEQIKQLRNLKKAILSSSVYKLLDGKTQMIEKKIDGELRSRLDHTKNVARITKRIVGRIYELCSIEAISVTETYKLNKQKAELEAEITALAHDLGHTPFGHNGEAALNEFMQSITDEDAIAKIIQERVKCFGAEYEEQQGHTEGFKGKLSFEHNEQSAMEFMKIIEQNPEAFDKINTKKMITGILAHSISRVPEVPDDLVSQIVRQTDKIEYRNKDYDEIRKYIVFKEGEEELQAYDKKTSGERISEIVEDIANEAVQKGRIDDDNEALKKCKQLRKKYESIVYFIAEDGKRGLLTGDNKERQQLIYRKLLEYYYNNPEKIPTKSLTYTYPIKSENQNERVVSFDSTKSREDTLIQQVINYINTFTNKKCYETYMRLIKERIVKGVEYGIEPITQEEIEERKKIEISQQIAKLRAKDIYKGRETHTDQEYLAILHSKYKRFVENDLTDEARAAIERNRAEHERENAGDTILLSSVQAADEKRLDLEKVKERYRQYQEQSEQEEK